jgi:photosystem II stability/assembly factor-like uncharacterized protein
MLRRIWTLATICAALAAAHPHSSAMAGAAMPGGAAEAPAPPAEPLQAGTWVRQRTGTSQTLRAVFFVDRWHGWAVGGEGEVDCMIVRTTDGERWSKPSCPVDARLGAVGFADQNVGWAAGDAGTILRTSDGGATWFPQSSGVGEGITGIKVWDARTVYASTRGGGVLKTTDGGSTWRQQPTPAGLGLFDIDFVDPNNGWAVGSKGTMLRTTDGGVSWNRLPFSEDVRFYGVDFLDGAVGWVGGNRLYRSEDGGYGWTRQAVHEVAKTVEDLSAVDRDYAWAVGDEGMILRTADGGRHWTREAPDLVGTGLKGVFFLDRSIGWIVGNEGKIFRFTTALVPAPSPAPPTATRVPSTRTPTPTATATRTPTPTPTFTPTPTATPVGPWLDAGDVRRPLVIAPGGLDRIGLVYGNLPVTATIGMTLTGPVLFPASTSQRWQVAVNGTRGSMWVDVAAVVDAAPGVPFAFEATAAGVRAARDGVIARSVYLPLVRDRR